MTRRRRRRISDQAAYRREVEELEDHGPRDPGPDPERFPQRADDEATGRGARARPSGDDARDSS